MLERDSSRLVLLFLFALGVCGCPSGKMDAIRPTAGDAAEPSLPFTVELVPQAAPSAGRITPFVVNVQSNLDPDTVRDIHVEYELPRGVIRPAAASLSPERVLASGLTRLELGVVLPDESTYPIRARVVVRLTNGKTIAQSAVYWANPGKRGGPNEIVNRMSDADGTGIRIYRGMTVRVPQ